MILTNDVVDEIEALAAAIPDPPGPEQPEKNIAYRKRIRELGKDSMPFRAAWKRRCAADPVFWMNSTVWTQNPKDFAGEDTTRPVILFPKQAGYIRSLHDHVERGEPLLLRKSREQLASVATANYALWRLIYSDNCATLIGSYKAHVVEGSSYAKAIFPKIDFTIKLMEDWELPDGWVRKRPGPCRKDMIFQNPVNDKAIEGDTCNDDFARSGRFAWVWVDEFAHIGKQDDIHTAVGNTTNCFVYTTTPKGIELFQTMVDQGNIDVYTLHWTDNYLWHPKGFKPEECDWENGIWPKEWICEPGCRAHLAGGKPHSERFDKECKKYNWNQAKIAQELEMDGSRSGGAVFNQDKIQAAKKHLIENRQEFKRFKLSFKTSGLDGKKATVDLNGDLDQQFYKQLKKLPVYAEECLTGPLRVWRLPFSCREPKCACKGTGLHTYVLGGDTALNVDGDAYCAYILDITTGQIVAEWHGHISSTKAGVEWAKLCKWYGTSTCPGWRDAWAVVESNQQGLVTNETMVSMGVLVHINRNESSMKKKLAPRLGVFTNRHNKSHIINKCLQPEIDESGQDYPLLPRLCNPFMEFWTECETFYYIYSEKGTQRPESAKMGTRTRAQHDDRVIACAMAVYGALDRYGKIRDYMGKSDFVITMIRKANQIGVRIYKASTVMLGELPEEYEEEPQIA